LFWVKAYKLARPTTPLHTDDLRSQISNELTLEPIE